MILIESLGNEQKEDNINHSEIFIVNFSFVFSTSLWPMHKIFTPNVVVNTVLQPFFHFHSRHSDRTSVSVNVSSDLFEGLPGTPSHARVTIAKGSARVGHSLLKRHPLLLQ